MQICSEAELKAIHRLPQHLKVKHQAWLLVTAGVTSTLLTLGTLTSTAYYGHYVLLYYRQIWWEFGFGAGFGALSLLFTGFLSSDVRNLQDPIQLILDIVRLEFSALASASLLIVLYCKIKTLDPETVFNLGCTSNCAPKWHFFRLAPLIVGCITIFIALLELALFFLMFRNPLVNPPITPIPSAFAQNAPLLQREEPMEVHEESEEYEEEYEMETRVRVDGRRRRLGAEEGGLGYGRMRYSSERPQREQHEIGRM